MPITPNVYGGDHPFLLVFDRDRERVVRFLADAGVAMVLSTEGTSLSRVELPGCNRRQALRLVERMTRQGQRERLGDEDGEQLATAFSMPNRLRLRGLLDD